VVGDAPCAVKNAEAASKTELDENAAPATDLNG
jgi:hypothetical protein